jgi:hypothetical protein
MSHINDALQRAKESQQSPSGVRINLEPPHATAATAELREGPRGFFITLVVLLIIAACGFIGFAFLTSKPPVQVALVPIPPPVPKPAPVVTTQMVAVVVNKPVTPTLKLQGIFYNESKWQAIVNGQSVNVGDNVEGFRVKLISKNNISLMAPNGSQKTLTLGE